MYQLFRIAFIKQFTLFITMLFLLLSDSYAIVVQGTIQVTASVTAQCNINSIGNLSFPTISSVGALSSDVTSSSTIIVTCTNSAPYNIGLDAGANSSNVNSRVLKSGSNTLTYSLYQNLTILLFGVIPLVQTP